MDRDQITGKVQNAFGKVEEAVGEAIGSRDLSNAGAEDRLKGAAKETWGNAKDTVNTMSDTARTQAAVDREREIGRPTAAREQFANGVENIRDSISTKLDEMKQDEHFKRDELRRTA